MIASMASKFPTRPVGIVYGTLNNPLTVVEVFLDLICPYSCRMFKTLRDEGILEDYKDTIQFRMMQTIQPWHVASGLAHSCVLSMMRVDDSITKNYFGAMFDRQEQFFDDNIGHKSKNEILGEMADIGAELGANKEDILSWAAMDAENNGGKSVDKAMKLCTKYHRARGVHVTPTVFINGLEASEISSSWTADEWRELLNAIIEHQGDGQCNSCHQI